MVTHRAPADQQLHLLCREEVGQVAAADHHVKAFLEGRETGRDAAVEEPVRVQVSILLQGAKDFSNT